MSSFVFSKKLYELPKSSVFAEFTALAAKYGAVNLGQGYPTWGPCDMLQGHLINLLNSHEPLNHQYARMLGHPSLVKALAKYYAPKFEQVIDPMQHILVTNGCTGALFCALTALVDEGDEVVVFEPFFDLYAPDVLFSQGKVVPVRLRPNGHAWSYNIEELEAAFSTKTKLVLINTPQNVPGKVWTRNELEDVAKLCIKYNCLAVTDEVYEHITFDSREHIHMASLPNMWERTLTLSSAGKTFSCTGWKIGWCVGPSEAISHIARVHAQASFSVATPLQIAVARTLEDPLFEDYLVSLKQDYNEKKQFLLSVLERVGFQCVKPDGSYFIAADISRFPDELYRSCDSCLPRDVQFCSWMAREIKVVAIPMSVFYKSDPNRTPVDNFVRFAFCKTLDDLTLARDKFESLKSRLE